MNRILFICGFIVIFFSAQSQNLILDSIVNINEVQKILSFLASDSTKGRFTGTDEAKKVATFIVSQFKSARLTPIAGYENCLMPFNVSMKNNESKTTYNVLAGLSGKTKPDEIIIFSAHYDHIGTFSTNPYPSVHPEEFKNKKDSIYNGANDDASGVTSLILLARYFAALNNNERTLIFVAFSAEELGLLGSAYFADLVVPKQIIAVINMEMLGRDPGGKGGPFITGGELSNMRSILNKELEKKDIMTFGKNFFRIDPYINENLFYRSDNISFANLGIPAHTLMLTSDYDKYYHSVKDEVETLDFNTMKKIIQAIALSSESLIKGTATPTRIKTISNY
jgi:putative aminopeptidase FrvX